MNNKQIGNEFEWQMCDILSKRGFWVHFISPNRSGAQPFDLIIAKDGFAMAADCKTCEDHIFRFGRLEQNQIMAFEKWLACGNLCPVIYVKHKDCVYVVKYKDLKEKGKVDLNEELILCDLRSETK